MSSNKLVVYLVLLGNRDPINPWTGLVEDPLRQNRSGISNKMLTIDIDIKKVPVDQEVICYNITTELIRLVEHPCINKSNNMLTFDIDIK